MVFPRWSVFQFCGSPHDHSNRAQNKWTPTTLQILDKFSQPLCFIKGVPSSISMEVISLAGAQGTRNRKLNAMSDMLDTDRTSLIRNATHFCCF